MWTTLLTVIAKEYRQTFRDKRMVALLMVAPVLQLLVLEIRNPRPEGEVRAGRSGGVQSHDVAGDLYHVGEARVESSRPSPSKSQE